MTGNGAYGNKAIRSFLLASAKRVRLLGSIINLFCGQIGPVYIARYG